MVLPERGSRGLAPSQMSAAGEIFQDLRYAMPSVAANAAKHQEDVCMKALRRAGHPLLNKNCAMDANEERRLASKRWRDAHPGYMAQKSREARQRRRLALEAEHGSTD